MLAKHSILARLLVVVMVGCAFLAAPRPSVAAPGPDTEPYVKYYQVTARYQGQPENLTEIARRFLGSGERSAEIYQLNTGRVQPDGARLTDPAELRAGWYLVLPWDAAGDGVEYGQLPTPAGRRPAPPRPARRAHGRTPARRPAARSPRPGRPPARRPDPRRRRSAPPRPRPAAGRSGRSSAWRRTARGP
ncbi:hypothetical protein [Micromonospora robiginosa]|uniref:LysM domain-containing protein n=1 Tax=Micromonospora robiginosa TaxID=2749844 RepID=A0AAF0SWX4_9ACTN|nr:hypothetical protein [Micromonospora ferruginea]WMF04496.1 hypothetical protein H1D33_30130 [Micromonospora ferruginea]